MKTQAGTKQSTSFCIDTFRCKYVWRSLSLRLQLHLLLHWFIQTSAGGDGNNLESKACCIVAALFIAPSCAVQFVIEGFHSKCFVEASFAERLRARYLICPDWLNALAVAWCISAYTMKLDWFQWGGIRFHASFTCSGSVSTWGEKAVNQVTWSVQCVTLLQRYWWEIQNTTVAEDSLWICCTTGCIYDTSAHWKQSGN